MKHDRQIPDLPLAVESCIAEHDTKQAAAEALLTAAKADPALYAQMLGPYEMRAALIAVGSRLAKTRMEVWQSAPKAAAQESDGAASGGRVAALVRANTHALMCFPLPGGQPLGQASASDVRDGARFYLERARDMGWKGRWLEAVAGRMAEGKTVGEQFSETDLAEMREGTS